MNVHDIWKQSQGASTTTPDEICKLARSREREAIWTKGLALFALGGILFAFAHNMWTIDAPQPLARAGHAWNLIVLAAYFGGVIRSRSAGRGTNESCAGFLVRSLEARRDTFYGVCRVVLLLIPGIAAGWLAGNNSALAVKAMGLNPSSAYAHYVMGIGPRIATVVLITVLLTVFGVAGQQVSKELEAMRRRVASA